LVTCSCDDPLGCVTSIDGFDDDSFFDFSVAGFSGVGLTIFGFFS
jgi:hypothetical protein